MAVPRSPTAAIPMRILPPPRQGVVTAMGKREEGIPPPFERRGGFPLRFGCLLSVKLKLRRRGEAMVKRPWPMHRVPCPPPALCDPPCHTPKSSGVSGRTYHLLAGASPSEEASRSWVKERGIPLPGRERGIPIPRWERGEGRVRKAGKASLPCPHPEGCLSRETRSIPVGILSKSTHPERRSWRRIPRKKEALPNLKKVYCFNTVTL